MNTAPTLATAKPLSAANPKAHQSYLIEFENANVHNHTEFSVGLQEQEQTSQCVADQSSGSGSTNSSLLPETTVEGENIQIDISSNLSKGYLKNMGNPMISRTLTIRIGEKVVQVNDYFTLINELTDESKVMFGKVNATIPKSSSRSIKSNTKFSLRKRVRPVCQFAKEKRCSQSQNPFKVLRTPLGALGRTNS